MVGEVAQFFNPVVLAINPCILEKDLEKALLEKNIDGIRKVIVVGQTKMHKFLRADCYDPQERLSEGEAFKSLASNTNKESQEPGQKQTDKSTDQGEVNFDKQFELEVTDDDENASICCVM